MRKLPKRTFGFV